MSGARAGTASIGISRSSESAMSVFADGRVPKASASDRKTASVSPTSRSASSWSWPGKVARSERS
eukprot:3582784-Alexandrium_andersonii.AAC.1